MIYSDEDDVRESGDVYQLQADSEYLTENAEMAEVRTISDSDDTVVIPRNDADERDLASKPITAPLSSRASAFSIAALMKDCDKDTSTAPSPRSDDDTCHNGLYYDTAATDQWQRHVRDSSGSAELVNSNYWATFSNTCASQRRTYIGQIAYARNKHLP